MIRTLKGGKLTWWNVIRPTRKDLDIIKNNFSLHPVNFTDIMGTAHHPKIDQYKNYTFLVLLFPLYNRKQRTISPVEVDLVIGNDYIISIHDNSLVPFNALFKHEEFVMKMKKKKESALNNIIPIMLVHKILEDLFMYIYPMIDHISIELDEIERNIFLGYEKQMVNEILITKRKIVNLRRIMQTHKNLIKKLTGKDKSIIKDVEAKLYFEDLIDRSKEIWQILESQNEHIDALHASNESLISFRLNDVMKTLTIFSVVVFPLTLFAAVFGMNTVNMPFARNPYGFWIIIGLMGLGTFLLILYFKKRKWL